MKFVEAIKALGPGKLLINPAGAKLELRDGFLWIIEMPIMPDRILYQDKDGWQVIDKPRPRVKFADAIAAAAKGAKILCCASGDYYQVVNGVPVISGGHAVPLESREISGDWEIIEAEDGK